MPLQPETYIRAALLDRSSRVAYTIEYEKVEYIVLYTEYQHRPATVSVVVDEKEDTPVVVCTYQEGLQEEEAVLEEIKKGRARLD